MNSKHTARTGLLETGTYVRMNLKQVNSLELAVKDEEVDQCSESQSVLNRWRNHFCQLLNV